VKRVEKGVIMIKPKEQLGRDAWVRINNRLFKIGGRVTGGAQSPSTRMPNEGRYRMREGHLSRKEALLFSVLAISGFVSLLYLAAFAGILLLAHRTGLVIIKADTLMPAESAIMLSACIVMAFITIYSLAAIASELRLRR